MTLRQRLNHVGLKNISRMHRAVVHATGGRVGSMGFGMPVVELTTVGRTSGRPRSVMLTAPVIDGDRVVLVASKYGDDRHPDWYHNLVAEPAAELTVKGQRRAVCTRTTSPDERADLWPRVIAVYPGYATYQRRTEREIPLVICDPR